MRIKILYRKNLGMTDGKLAAQAVHAAIGLAVITPVDPNGSVVVLGVFDKKFEEAKISAPSGYRSIVKDKGYTEVDPGTETCMAFMEEDPRESVSLAEIGVVK